MTTEFLGVEDCKSLLQLLFRFRLFLPVALGHLLIYPSDQIWRHNLRYSTRGAAVAIDIKIARS